MRFGPVNRISHLPYFNNISAWSEGLNYTKSKLEKLKNRSVIVKYQKRNEKTEKDIKDVLVSYNFVHRSDSELNQSYFLLTLNLKKSGTFYFIVGEESDLKLNNNAIGLFRSVKLDLT